MFRCAQHDFGVSGTLEPEWNYAGCEGQRGEAPRATKLDFFDQARQQRGTAHQFRDQHGFVARVSAFPDGAEAVESREFPVQR